jgi:hypothetical protein
MAKFQVSLQELVRLVRQSAGDIVLAAQALEAGLEGSFPDSLLQDLKDDIKRYEQLVKERQKRNV